MSRKRGVGEIGVLAGFLLAGCATESGPEHPWVLTKKTTGSGFGYVDPPEQVTYARALQCGALIWAHDRPNAMDRSAPPDGTAPFASKANTYLSWAELRARSLGDDPGFALPDMAALRDDLIASAGGATDTETRMKLEEVYKSELAACVSTAENADVIWVTVGG